MTNKHKNKIGQFIQIDWENDTDVEYVYGHVTTEVANLAYKNWVADNDLLFYGIKHRWARWVPAEHFSNYSSLLYVYDEKQRGTFAVTELQLNKW
jgi:hypothetical protein